MPKEVTDNLEIISFVEEGETTREEVLLRLGTPSSHFDKQRILTYQIAQDGSVFWPRMSPQSPALKYGAPNLLSLVLVFNDQGVLERHSIVGAFD